MQFLLTALGNALWLSVKMLWETLWGINLGFIISAMVDVLISKSEMTRLMPDHSLRSMSIACGLGAASSSCSYAAVAIARSIFRKGADFTSSMAFQFASTNLVIELGILLIILMGWQFALAEFVGGPIMIALMTVLFKWFLKPKMLDQAREQADKGLKGSMEGHAMMATMQKKGTIMERLTSSDGWTSISHYFVMNWSMLWKDIFGGMLIAGALGAWVPKSFWQQFFLIHHSFWGGLWGPVIGPVIAVFSFVCSIGNVPMAAILWNGGISFGGVVAFIFGDLIIVPILNIYRKYYGRKMSIFLLIVFYAAMVISAFVIQESFGWIGLVPHIRAATVTEITIRFNYTAVLNILLLLAAGVLFWRFAITGGPAMMRNMNEDGHNHSGHKNHHH